MAKKYSITFKSLRAGIVYTLSIYDADYAGSVIPLKAAGTPFVTDEDDTDDMFTPIRTQTGYLRIVDDGTDLNGNALNWKELLPQTDTSHPVKLSHMEGETEVTDWLGFMQAQNFSGQLYNARQERDLPVQCALSAMLGQYVSTEQTELKNFAYLLKAALESVPAEGRPTHIAVQGGTKAQEWLLKRLDWQNLISEDDDGQATARYDMYTCLEDMCNYWGLTARTYRHWLILEMADDSEADTWLTMTTEELATMAGGTAAGTTDGEWEVKALSGDIFASMSNDDTRLRGYSKAIVTADTGDDGEDLVEYATDRMVEEMEKKNYGTPIQDGDKYVAYTEDTMSFGYAFQSMAASEGYGSFNMAAITAPRSSDPSKMAVMRIKKSYAAAQPAAISLATAYAHCFFNGTLRITGDVYRLATKYESQDDIIKKMGGGMGNKTMVCALGIGNTRQTCKWFNGQDWQDESCTFTLSVGNTDGSFYVVRMVNGVRWSSRTISPSIAGQSGRIFFDIYGSSDVEERDGQRSFEITNFAISFGRSDWTFDSQHWYTDSRKTTRTYKATNGNANDEEYDVNGVYGSDNRMSYGFGLLMNTNNTYVGKLTYGTLSLYPEQRLANRVAAYWEHSRRQLRMDLRTNAVGEITPRQHLTIDGSEMYPAAISRDWRNDVTTVVAIEVDPLPEPEPEE